MSDFSSTTYALLRTLLNKSNTDTNTEISNIKNNIYEMSTDLETIKSYYKLFDIAPKTHNVFTFPKYSSGMIIYPGSIGTSTESMNAIIGFYRCTSGGGLILNRTVFGSASLVDFYTDNNNLCIDHNDSSGHRFLMCLSFGNGFPSVETTPIVESTE